MTRHYLYFEAGVLRTDSQQVPLAHITDIDLSQTMIQKARGVATIRVHVQRPDGPMEVVTMENLTESRAVQDVINQAARARKAELTREATTHTYLGGTAPGVPQAPAPQPVAAQPDIRSLALASCTRPGY
ncbi:PH domain-containing protein [Paenarthrobacter sp. NPDC089316]|uniref:PH domain-containing protein n=1 Tax=unclassified Paenarthrobacter TaxID=2634190 RepID=UPI0034297287